MSHRIQQFAIFIASFALCVGFAACEKQESSLQSMKQSGDPDDPAYGFESDDAQMNAAVATAKSSVDQFIAALKDPSQAECYFSVKKPFPVSEGGSEHIWLARPSFDGSSFHGYVANSPAHLPDVKEGDKATVSKTELSDWMIVKPDGRLVGGYTIRVFRDRMSASERAQFDQDTGFKFD